MSDSVEETTRQLYSVLICRPQLLKLWNKSRAYLTKWREMDWVLYLLIDAVALCCPGWCQTPGSSDPLSSVCP